MPKPQFFQKSTGTGNTGWDALALHPKERYERFVDPLNGDNANDGLSWATAKRGIIEALASVPTAGKGLPAQWRNSCTLHLGRGQHVVSFPVTWRSGDVIQGNGTGYYNTTDGESFRGTEIFLANGKKANVTGTGSTIDATSHPFVNNDIVRFTRKQGGSSLKLEYPYKVINATADTFQLAEAGASSALSFGSNITATSTIEYGNCEVMRSNNFFQAEDIISTEVTALDSTDEITFPAPHGLAVGNPIYFSRIIGSTTKVIPFRIYEVHTVPSTTVITIRHHGDSVMADLGGSDTGQNAMVAGTTVHKQITGTTLGPNLAYIHWWQLRDFHINANAANQDAQRPIFGIAYDQMGESSHVRHIMIDEPGNKFTNSTSVTAEVADHRIDATGHPFNVGDKVMFTALNGGSSLRTYHPYVVVETDYNPNWFRIAELGTGTALTIGSDIVATSTIIKCAGGGGIFARGAHAPHMIGPTVRVENAKYGGWFAFACDSRSKQNTFLHCKSDDGGSGVWVGIIGWRGSGVVELISSSWEEQHNDIVLMEHSGSNGHENRLVIESLAVSAGASLLSNNPNVVKLWSPAPLGSFRLPTVMIVDARAYEYKNWIDDTFRGVTVPISTTNPQKWNAGLIIHGSRLQLSQMAQATLAGNDILAPTIASAAAGDRLTWSGSIWQNRRQAAVYNTTPVTVSAADPAHRIVDSTGGTRTQNLPASSGLTGLVIGFTRVGGNTVTIARNGSDTIWRRGTGSATQITLNSEGAGVVLALDGTVWRVIGEYDITVT